MNVVHVLTALPWWLVLMAVALLPALEASTLVGLVIPGESAVLAGGVVAHAGLVPLWAVVLAAGCGAVAGDQVGYLLGRRYGPALVRRLPGPLRSSAGLDRALRLVRRHGALAVVIGRWAASLRALVPGVAGMCGVNRVRFTAANLAGGVAWAGGVAVAGYIAGASYTMLSRRLGIAGVILALVVVLLVVGYVARRRGGSDSPVDVTDRYVTADEPNSHA